MGNWNNDIDDVARDMTEGGPDGSFKARVLSRIDTDEPRPWPLRSLWTWSSVIAAAAVLALVFIRPPWKADTPSTVPLKPDTTYVPTDDSTRGGAEAAGARREGTLAATAPATSRLPSSPARSGADSPSPVAVVSEAPVIRVDRIDTLEPSPIRIESLGVEAMETTTAIPVPRLTVAPFEVPPLAVARLEVSAMGEQQ
jgi:hypothetical protein